MNKQQKCTYCNNEFNLTQHNKKYCSKKCAYKSNDEKRKILINFKNNGIIFEKPPVKIYGINQFDWRDYPYGVIV